MLSCVDADPKHLATLPIPMTDFREMANAVIGDNGELLEYQHLIANEKTRAIWQHSYGKDSVDSPKECQAKTKAPTPCSSSGETRYPGIESRT